MFQLVELFNRSKRRNCEALRILALGCALGHALEKWWVCGAPVQFRLTGKSKDGLYLVGQHLYMEGIEVPSQSSDALSWQQIGRCDAGATRQQLP